ncbi:MAG: hypothetical protein CMP84_11500 [Gammaproteobacteria bacterium]|nr:hypothetical protein [Gammaproteobacteria bacterium]MBU13736.1 hypothetical protein [Gammaproteobacteria bacterium]
MKIGLTVWCLLLSSVTIAQSNQQGGWIQLFNGEDLNDWVPKFTGYPLGENYLDTFRVEDGLFKVSYENWNDFNSEFGHIFYREPFSHYLLRVEYRFVGDQVTNGPGWAYRNNGIMFHSQSPESMTLDQEFPASIEAQMLGGNGEDERHTANVCSPGTHYVMDGELVTVHCINSSSQTYHGDQWVTMELEVRGSDMIRHVVNGETVFEYSDVQLDPEDPDAQRLLASGSAIEVTGGYISVQAESHPMEIRKLEVFPLAL